MEEITDVCSVQNEFKAHYSPVLATIWTQLSYITGVYFCMVKGPHLTHAHIIGVQWLWRPNMY